LEREPGLQIIFLGGSEIESARNDGDDAVRDAEGLVEAFGIREHNVKHLPGFLWRGYAELGV